MALTGLTINEADALFAGLADYFVPIERATRCTSSCWRTTDRRPHGRPRVLDPAAVVAACRFKAGLPTSNLRQYFDALRFIAANRR